MLSTIEEINYSKFAYYTPIDYLISHLNISLKKSITIQVTKKGKNKVISNVCMYGGGGVSFPIPHKEHRNIGLNLSLKFLLPYPLNNS